MPLLRLNGHCGDGTSLQSLDADRLVSLFAVSVGAKFDPGQRLVDLGDQLARPAAGAQFQSTVALDASAIGNIGFLNSTLRQACQRAVRFRSSWARQRSSFWRKYSTWTGFMKSSSSDGR